MFIILNFGIGYAAEFEIEDIITAIKKDIQTVMMTRTGNPHFEIENVPICLAEQFSFSYREKSQNSPDFISNPGFFDLIVV